MLAVFEFVVLLLAISVHDAAQAWVAWRMGDLTAKMLGRITMNPAKHFDLFGTLDLASDFYLPEPSCAGVGQNLSRSLRAIFVSLTGTR